MTNKENECFSYKPNARKLMLERRNSVKKTLDMILNTPIGELEIQSDVGIIEYTRDEEISEPSKDVNKAVLDKMLLTAFAYHHDNKDEFIKAIDEIMELTEQNKLLYGNISIKENDYVNFNITPKLKYDHIKIKQPRSGRVIVNEPLEEVIEISKRVLLNACRVFYPKCGDYGGLDNVYYIMDVIKQFIEYPSIAGLHNMLAIEQDTCIKEQYYDTASDLAHKYHPKYLS